MVEEVAAQVILGVTHIGDGAVTALLEVIDHFLWSGEAMGGAQDFGRLGLVRAVRHRLKDELVCNGGLFVGRDWPLHYFGQIAEDNILTDRDVLGAFSNRPGFLVWFEVPLGGSEAGDGIEELLTAFGQFSDGAVAFGLGKRTGEEGHRNGEGKDSADQRFHPIYRCTEADALGEIIVHGRII